MTPTKIQQDLVRSAVADLAAAERKLWHAFKRPSGTVECEPQSDTIDSIAAIRRGLAVAAESAEWPE